MLIPTVFASSNLGLRTNILLVLITIFVIIFLTFYSEDLPRPLSNGAPALLTSSLSEPPVHEENINKEIVIFKKLIFSIS